MGQGPISLIVPAGRQQGNSPAHGRHGETSASPGLQKRNLNKRVSTAGRLAGTIAVRFGAAQGTFDNGGDAPNTRLNFNCFLWAVALAGAAFHACIPIGDSGHAMCYVKDTVRTDRGAHAAAVASRFVQLKGHNVGEIAKARCHKSHPLDPCSQEKRLVIHRAIPKRLAAAWSGTAIRISRRTPESEV